MARAGILYSQVAKAAAQLAAAGKTPTIDTVREALGDTGSKSTIAPMLKRWKTEHQEVVADANLGLPVELVDAVKSIYERLQGDVARQLEEASQAHDKALDAMRDQRDAAQVELAQLRQAHSALMQESTQAQQTLAQRLQELQAQALALTAAQTENAGLQQRLADRAAEAHALNQQLTQARAQFEHFQEAAARQRAEERQAFEQHLARLEQENISGQRRQEAQQATLGQQEATLAHQMSELERLHDALAEAHSELHQVRSERTQQTAQLQELAVARGDTERRLDMAQQALIEAKTGVATAGKQIEMLTSQLATAERKADQAERDKAAWIDKILAQLPDKAATEAPIPHGGQRHD
jgi:chromosome segregation ATPase|tara:strand:- start:230 stop:1291 length:1062 start_codon:yes stop_codon:yes gene_type:complete